MKKLFIVFFAFFLSLSAPLYSYAYTLEVAAEKISAPLKKIFVEAQGESISSNIWIASNYEPTAIESINSTAFQELLSETLSEQQGLEMVHQLRAARAAEAKAYFSQLNSKFVDSLPDNIVVEYVSDFSPVIRVKATASEIKSIARNISVEIIDANTEAMEPQLGVSRVVTGAASIEAGTSSGGSKGSGVRIGMIDSGLPDVESATLASADIITAPNITGHRDHATTVANVMVSQGNANTALGIASEATLYATAGDLVDSLDWLVDNSVDVVNVSQAFGYEIDGVFYPYTNEYRFDDRIIDYYVSNYNMSICVSAGNWGMQGVSSPGMAYNAITVANFNDNNTLSLNDDAITSGSSYMNILSINGAATKPDIAAPGANIMINGVNTSGTSISAPHVTACIALIGNYSPVMLLSPASVKAALCAGVQDVRRYTPMQRGGNNSYLRFGAGMIDAATAASIATSNQFDFGFIYSASTYFDTTVSCSANKSMRVALTMLQDISSYNLTSSATFANLDLEVYNPNGVQIALSTTTNNNM